MPTPPPKPLTYKDSGVNPSAADSATDSLRHLAQRTHSSRVLPNFAGTALFRLDFPEKLFAKHYKDPVLIASAAGVGTKTKIASALQKYDTLGIDLVAINVNDLIIQGGEPLFFQHRLALHANDPARTTALIKGISDGCMDAACALLGGETAEMPALLSPGDFDLAGFALGVVEKSKLLNPHDIQPGDSIIGLASSGLHANGYALVRRVLEKSGIPLDALIPELNTTLADELLRPSRIYVNSIQRILARYKVKKIIKAMAHITSGGLPGSLARALPDGLAARLKRDAWTPPPIFHWLQTTGPIDTDEMFRVFNMGIGFVLIVRPTFTKPIMSALRALREKPSFLGKIRKAGSLEPPIEWS